MKQVYSFLFLLQFTFAFNFLNAQCDNGRYYNSIFPNSITNEGLTTVQYGEAVEYNGVDTPLLVDIYQPIGDNFAHRPLIIYAFGGSFVSGIRQSPDIVTMALYLSARGYVVASIDYRLGSAGGTGNDTDMFAALIRGEQDMKASVRYFYKDAQTVDQFRIDTNQIFIAGVSAGAFIALDYAYMKLDTFSKTPPGFAAPTVIALGGVDGNSGNPGYSQKVKGVIDLSGAIGDTVWIMPGDPMLVGEHGTNDSLVTCWWDSAYGATHTTSSLFGGGDIKNRLSHIPFNDSMYLFWGAGHCPFILPYDSSIQALEAIPLYMDTTEWLIRDFLYKNIVCDTETTSGINSPQGKPYIAVYPNPSNEFINVDSHEQQDLDVTVVNVLGQALNKYVLPAGATLTISKESLSSGMYLFEFSDRITGRIYNTEKVVFY